jgi:S1-C subfamily serine protease
VRLEFVVLAGVCVIAASAIAQGTASRGVVVEVEAPGLRAATGFVVGDGRVVTVAHAVGDGEVVVAGRPAVVVRRDEELDLALLSVPGLERRGAALIGGPRVVVLRDGAAATVPAEILRRIEARVRFAATGTVVNRPALELAADIGAGDSGAPVIGADGRVAGVVFARSTDRAGIAYAVELGDFAR